MMEVEREMDNIGRMFMCCTLDCGYFQWRDVLSNKNKVWFELGQPRDICDESETKGGCSRQTKATEPFQDLSQILQTVADLKIEEDDVEILFNLTIRKENMKSDNKGKGKCREDWTCVQWFERSLF